MVPDINIEVCYALQEQQYRFHLTVPSGTTVDEAIRRSGVLESCPDIDLQSSRVGVFSEFRALDDVVEDGDRLEIYRPLKADPKEARRQRARKRER